MPRRPRQRVVRRRQWRRDLFVALAAAVSASVLTIVGSYYTTHLQLDASRKSRIADARARIYAQFAKAVDDQLTAMRDGDTQKVTTTTNDIYFALKLVYIQGTPKAYTAAGAMAKRALGLNGLARQVPQGDKAQQQREKRAKEADDKQSKELLEFVDMVKPEVLDDT
jgi:hypothetical protein